MGGCVYLSPQCSTTVSYTHLDVYKRQVEETYYYQGLALRAAGDEAGAQEALARAAALNPNSPIGRAAQDGL